MALLSLVLVKLRNGILVETVMGVKRCRMTAAPPGGEESDVGNYNPTENQNIPVDPWLKLHTREVVKWGVGLLLPLPRRREAQTLA